MFSVSKLAIVRIAWCYLLAVLGEKKTDSFIFVLVVHMIVGVYPKKVQTCAVPVD